MPQENPPMSGPDRRTHVVLLVPAILVGVLSALVLWGLDEAAHGLQVVMWDVVPDSTGLPRDSAWLTIGILTLTGLAVGLVAQFLPGHAGPDSATTELDSPPPPLKAVPTILLAVLLSLAGGVSLGPENPIVAVNGALTVALFARFLPRVPAQMATVLAVSATIGALFGTPVAAALILTGAFAAVGGGSLWDKLFLPVASAGAGALTMKLLGAPQLGFVTEPATGLDVVDFLVGVGIALFAAGLGILAAVAFPLVHRAFHALRHPVLFTTLGGLTLGILGALGGPLTLFKGAEETGEIIANYADYTFGALVWLFAFKLVALLVSASAGFRGGRIFPALFVGVAAGLAVQSLVPSVPVGLAVACGAMGIVLQTMRDGWAALFIGIAVTEDLTLLPMLCIIVLPVWLLVSRAPRLEIHAPAPPVAAAAS